MQLDALRDFTCAWARPRPAQLPYRAHAAADWSGDRALRSFIFQTWEELTELAHDSSLNASHKDWRVDNFLFGSNERLTVLDWESIVMVPTAEAVGYAAASFTHSWQDALYKPFTVEDANLFTAAITQNRPDIAEGVSGLQLRLATAFAGTVRLAEDQARGGPFWSQKSQKKPSLRSALRYLR